jgi:hypothetical protein
MLILAPHASRLSPPKTQIPVGPLTVDWQHPLANGLITAHLPGLYGATDLTNRAPSAVISSFAAGDLVFGALGPDGPALSMGTNTTGQLETGQSIPGLNVAARSIFVRFYRVGNPGNNQAIVAGSTFALPNASPFVDLWIQYSSSLTLLQLLYLQSGGTSASLFFNTNLSNNTMYSIGGTISNASGNIRAYLNGVQDSSASGVTFGSTATGDMLIAINGYNGMIHEILLWNRELSAAEMLQLHLEPYALFIPQETEMASVFTPPMLFILMPQIVT